MKFNVNQQDLQQALNYCQGVIEKRSTLPILSNILLDAQNSKLTITATDLDLIFINQINNVEVIEEGKTTTTSSTMYDIVRKLSSGKKINLTLTDNSKLHLESEKSIFNLNCMPASEFPLTDENFNENEFSLKSKDLLKLLNKCKFSLSHHHICHITCSFCPNINNFIISFTLRQDMSIKTLLYFIYFLLCSVNYIMLCVRNDNIAY